MSGVVKDGGAAFPETDYYDEKPIGSRGGMSLRDYFAAHALQGMIAAVGDNGPSNYVGLAEEAYVYADAMLNERAK